MASCKEKPKKWYKEPPDPYVLPRSFEVVAKLYNAAHPDDQVSPQYARQIERHAMRKLKNVLLGVAL